ncbi:MAG: hypothetical protein ACXV48_06590 [Halobacteriota archaeon]
MPSPFDVQGAISARAAFIIGGIIVTGLILAFTPISIAGYVLLGAAAVLYVFLSVLPGS